MRWRGNLYWLLKGWHVHPLFTVSILMDLLVLVRAEESESLQQAQCNYGNVGKAAKSQDVISFFGKGCAFAFEPNCAFGNYLANIGGTVIVGRDKRNRA